MGLRLWRRRDRRPLVTVAPPPVPRAEQPNPVPAAELPTRMRVVLADGTEAPLPPDPELRERIEYLARRIVPPAPPPAREDGDESGSSL